MKKLLILGLLLVGATFSNAQNVQRFGYSFDNTYSMHEGAKMNGTALDRKYTTYDYLFFANVFSVSDPVVIESGPDRNQTLGSLVDQQTGVNFGFGLFVTKRIFVGISSFYTSSSVNQFTDYLYSGPGDRAFLDIVQEEDVTALGDVNLMAKIRLGDYNKNSGFAIIPRVSFASGDEESFTTDKGLSYGLDVAADFTFDFAQVGASIGYQGSSDGVYIIPATAGDQQGILPTLSEEDRSTDLDYSSLVKLSLGSYIPFSDQFGANLEWMYFQNLSESDNNPYELYAGLRWQASTPLSFFGGVGLGTLEDSDRSTYRGVLGLKWTGLFAPAAPPITPAIIAQDDFDTTPFKTPKRISVLDNDTLKHIANPSLRIVSMTHPNQTNCEIVDTPLSINFIPGSEFIGKATCRYEVCSAEKLCQQADLVVEVLKPEQQYGDLVWNKSIYFCNDCDFLDARSKRVINELYNYIKLKGNKISRIIIEGHTSKRASMAYNMKLAGRRSKNAFNALVSKGVNPNILEMVSYGEFRPEVLNSAQRKHPTNRRVEFRIYEK